MINLPLVVRLGTITCVICQVLQSPLVFTRFLSLSNGIIIIIINQYIVLLNIGMGTLRIFGDSYGSNIKDGRPEILDQQWHRLLAAELGMDYENKALGATSIDYGSYVWYNARNDIQPGDRVVVTVTQPHQRWLLENEPGISIPATFFWGLYDDRITPEVKKAMELYFNHLYHRNAEESGLYNWMCSLDHVARSKGIKIVVLPSFKSTVALVEPWRDQFSHLHIAKGASAEISRFEHVKEMRAGMQIIRCGRANHLTPPNHKVLMEKLLAHFRDGAPVDLTEGFHKDLIRADNLEDTTLFTRVHEVVPEAELPETPSIINQ